MIAFLGDLHSNLSASRAVFERMEKLRIEKAYVVGDFVGYSCHPNEVVELCMTHSVEGVMGNHDEAALSGNVSGFNEVAVEAILWTRKNLSPSSRGFLTNLPSQSEGEIAKKKCLLVHGSPEEPLDEYVYSDYPENVLRRFCGSRDMLVMGHTHIPFLRVIREKTILNPGSVGQPRDGIPHASFALFDGERVTFERVEYDIENEARAILSCGLPSHLAERLFLGI
jgi:putative phosphoesterase